MWTRLYRRLVYLVIMLSLTSCGHLEGIGKGVSGAFKGFGKFLP